MSSRLDPVTDWWHTPRPPIEGQGPFTDFGQYGYGELDTRVFWQDVYWVDITGAPHFLVDMDPGHRATVIRFLRRGAASLWLHEVTHLAVTAATHPGADGDPAACLAPKSRWRTTRVSVGRSPEPRTTDQN